MKRSDKKAFDLFTRYLILVLVAIPNLWLFYTIFTPLTIYPLYGIFSIFFNASLNGNLITLGGCFPIEIIRACVAGSAYYLLLILNLSTPGIKFTKRMSMIGTSFLALLLLNILRIFVLGLMFVSSSSLFEAVHLLFWYAGSTIFVVGIWFIEVKSFKIKQIPIYSDIKFLINKIKN